MDFVVVWKAVSIVLTGLFGILGLLTEFKTKEGAITRWGYVSLVGILLSTTFGVAAQLRESSDSAAKALALAERSDKMLYSIQRQLYAIGQPTLHMRFSVPCSLQKFKGFCAALHTQSSKIRAGDPAVPGGQWQHWPADMKIRGELSIYKEDGTRLVTYSFAGARTGGDRSLVAMPGSDDAEITLVTKPTVLNNGFKSLIDFSGTTVGLDLPQPLADLNVTACAIETQDGEVLRLDIRRANTNYGILYW